MGNGTLLLSLFLSAAGSKPNRYIQKSVSSPVYESIAGNSTRETIPLSTQRPMGDPPGNNAATNQTNNSISSVDSSCPSVTVQPNVTVNTRECYDHLSVGKKAGSGETSSPVSPYELV